MTNKDKRTAITSIGLSLCFLNSFMAMLWYFDKPENKQGIAFVWVLLNLFVIAMFAIITFAYIKYPPSKD